MGPLIPFLIFLSCFGSVHLQVQVKPEEFVAAILDGKNIPICAGAFAHKQYVVTTAKCVYMKRGLRVASDSANTNQQNRIYEVTMTYIHPYYRAPMPDYDVAVLRVNSANNDNHLKPLTLQETEIGNVDYLFTGGWEEGAVDKKFKNGLTTLVERTKCAKELEKNVTVTRKLVCLDISKVNLAILDGSPANTLKDADHIHHLIGIVTKKFPGNVPSLFINVAHSEISIFLKSIIP